MHIIQSALRRAIFLLTLLFIIGLVNKAYAASINDLLISEVMANPSAVTDSNGEWFELYNPTSQALDLNGLSLSDNGSNLHTIDNGSALWINPGEYLVLARNADSLLNGGVSVDYSYGSSFTLNNSGDAIILSDSSGHELRLEYTSSFVVEGTSRELTEASMLLDNYLLATLPFGDGDLGTPGTGSFLPGNPASPVPLPAAAWLMGSGVLMLMGLARPLARREV